MGSPTQRTLALLRREGWVSQVVERWVPFAHRRIDLFSFGDIIAMRGYGGIQNPVGSREWLASGILLVQCTTADHQAARFAKMTTGKTADMVRCWLQAGGKIEIHGWAKRGERGKRKLWVCTRRPVLLKPNGDIYFEFEGATPLARLFRKSLSAIGR